MTNPGLDLSLSESENLQTPKSQSSQYFNSSVFRFEHCTVHDYLPLLSLKSISDGCLCIPCCGGIVCFFGNRIVSISQLGVRAPCFPLFVWCLQTIPPQQGMHRHPSDMDFMGLGVFHIQIQIQIFPNSIRTTIIIA